MPVTSYMVSQRRNTQPEDSQGGNKPGCAQSKWNQLLFFLWTFIVICMGYSSVISGNNILVLGGVWGSLTVQKCVNKFTGEFNICRGAAASPSDHQVDYHMTLLSASLCSFFTVSISSPISYSSIFVCQSVGGADGFKKTHQSVRLITDKSLSSFHAYWIIVQMCY